MINLDSTKTANIGKLTDSGMYNRPPPCASQLTMTLSVKLHTEGTNSGVDLNMHIYWLKNNYSDIHCKRKTKIPNLAEHKMKYHETSELGEAYNNVKACHHWPLSILEMESIFMSVSFCRHKLSPKHTWPASIMTMNSRAREGLYYITSLSNKSTRWYCRAQQDNKARKGYWRYS
jgi:hypothetical protein